MALSDRIPEPLKREIGGLPVWVWGVAGVVGIGLGVWLRRAGLFEGDGGDSNGGTPQARAVSLAPAGAPGVAGFPPPARNDTLEPFGNNTQWLAAAVQLSINAGVSPLDAQLALDLYLASKPLTDAQRTIVERVIRQLGLPPSPPLLLGDPLPSPVPTPPSAPTPTPPSPGPSAPSRPSVPAPSNPPSSGPGPVATPRPQRRTYTVVRGDTLSGIARKFYGANQGGAWPTIFFANRNLISNPDLIRPGWRLTIPPTVTSRDVARARRSVGQDSSPTTTPPASDRNKATGRTTTRRAGNTSQTLYTVARGDTLSAIALKFYGSARRSNVNKIAAANGIPDPDKIRTGQVLIIPR